MNHWLSIKQAIFARHCPNFLYKAHLNGWALVSKCSVSINDKAVKQILLAFVVSMHFDWTRQHTCLLRLLSRTLGYSNLGLGLFFYKSLHKSKSPLFPCIILKFSSSITNLENNNLRQLRYVIFGCRSQEIGITHNYEDAVPNSISLKDRWTYSFHLPAFDSLIPLFNILIVPFHIG